MVSLALLLLGVACTHTDPSDPPVRVVYGPATTTPPIQLTYSPDQDYWPAWTQDGKGILYAYVDAIDARHRCVGLLPAGGGTRIWEMCDKRTVMNDTLTSFGAFALDSGGKLLYTEMTAFDDGRGGVLPSLHLWLSDSAQPFSGRMLMATLPQELDGIIVSWLADLRWTGPNTFLALGQQRQGMSHCVPYKVGNKGAIHCESRDTSWSTAGVVIQGTIHDSSAVLSPIVGTEGATTYALANQGATLVFAIRNHVALFTVPLSGGSPSPNPSTTTTSRLVEVMGVTCRNNMCVYAQDSVFQSNGNDKDPSHFLWPDDGGCGCTFDPPLGKQLLYLTDLAAGSKTVLAENLVHVIYATPVVSPVSGDVVVQFGGGWGHLQTYSTRSTGDLFATDGNSVLMLYRDVLPKP